MSQSNVPLVYCPTGFNYVKTVRFADLSAAATTKVVDLFTIPADGIVREVGFYVNTAFDGGATSALTVEVGITGDDPDGFVTAKQIHVDDTEVSSGWSDGAYYTVGGDAGTKKAKVFDAASTSTISALFTATGGNTSVLTQGEITFFASVVDFGQIK